MSLSNSSLVIALCALGVFIDDFPAIALAPVGGVLDLTSKNSCPWGLLDDDGEAILRTTVLLATADELDFDLVLRYPFFGVLPGLGVGGCTAGVTASRFAGGNSGDCSPAFLFCGVTVPVWTILSVSVSVADDSAMSVVTSGSLTRLKVGETHCYRLMESTSQ